MLIKDMIHQEDGAIINTYISNSRALKAYEEKQTELKGEIILQ